MASVYLLWPLTLCRYTSLNVKQKHDLICDLVDWLVIQDIFCDLVRTKQQVVSQPGVGHPYFIRLGAGWLGPKMANSWDLPSNLPFTYHYHMLGKLDS